MAAPPMTLVVILTVRADAVTQFRDYERQAARLMAGYGGAIERTVVVTPATPDAPLKEIHVVTFPDAESLRAYQNDPALARLAPQRAAAVLSTQLFTGTAGPQYLAPSAGRGSTSTR